MNKGVAAFICAAVMVAGAKADWERGRVPAGITYLNGVTVNNAGIGCATGTVENNMPGVIKLKAGVWRLTSAPPYVLTQSSASPDGTLYAVDMHGLGVVWRLAANGGYWNTVVTGGFIGVHKYYAVAALGPREVWAFGVDTDGLGKIAYFKNDMPDRIFNLGRVSQGSEGAAHTAIVAPRNANPSGEVYFAVNVRSTEFGKAGWYLFGLHPSGEMAHYLLPPGTGYYCDGLAAYSPGEVRVAMTADGGGHTRMYSLIGGEFALLLTIPERVTLEAYPSPNEGWGVTGKDRVYHWSDSGFSNVYVLDGDVRDLDMISALEGWAVGRAAQTGLPVLWHYSANPNIAPTSLGRVKALFR
jgi:hypothetical protein